MFLQKSDLQPYLVSLILNSFYNKYCEYTINGNCLRNWNCFLQICHFFSLSFVMDTVASWTIFWHNFHYKISQFFFLLTVKNTKSGKLLEIMFFVLTISLICRLSRLLYNFFSDTIHKFYFFYNFFLQIFSLLSPIDCGNTEWKKLNGNNFVLTIPESDALAVVQL